jgi:hypothetical protein
MQDRDSHGRPGRGSSAARCARVDHDVPNPAPAGAESEQESSVLADILEPGAPHHV